MKALEGIRILDFTWVGAGSLATRFLAEHGAEVIKVESRVHPDGLRMSGPFSHPEGGLDRSGYFAERNANKRSISLNLKSDRGRQIARELALSCDAVANNFRPGVMERAGLGYADLSEAKPSLVYLSMSMHGSHGPYRDHLGYGATISAMTGLHALMRDDDRLPIGTNTNYPDHVANPAHAALAVVAALLDSQREGRGALIDLAQTEPMLALLEPALRDVQRSGRTLTPNSHPRWSPHGVLQSSDERWFAIAVSSDAEWARLCDVISPLAGHRQDDEVGRITNATDIERILVDWFGRCSALQIEEMAARHELPIARVLDIADLVRDARMTSRAHFVRLPHPVMGDTLYSQLPFRLSATAGSVDAAAPLLGQHTREVLGEMLGLSDVQLDELVAERALY